MSIYRLKNVVQNYAWGDRNSLSDLLGLENPEGLPQAELWMGAHPKAPSMVEYRSLEDIIASDPPGILGDQGTKGFGGKLPFLFKVLAAGGPLSIQAHPSLDEARTRFAREEQAGVPFDAPNRNYKDPNHKPEILCALTPFSALWGFRAPGEISRIFRLLGPWGEVLAEKPTLRDFFHTLMTGRPDQTASLLERAGKEGVLPGNHTGIPWVPRLIELFPGDVGALAPLYMNVVSLEPGEAIYIPSGELHAYLEGTGIELMANSDNVLRGGLTPKHVDIPELLSVLTFQGRAPSTVKPVFSEGVLSYPTPTREFLLSRIEMSPSEELTRCAANCEILLCLSGRIVLAGDGESLILRRGDSCFIGADTRCYTLKGEGVLYSATIPVP